MTNKPDSFDRLSRSLAGAKSRRETMRLFGGGIIAAASAVLASRLARAVPPDPHLLVFGGHHVPAPLGPCEHSKCEVGEALPFLCDDDPCRRSICEWDDYCCNPVAGHWDQICIGYVKSRCGKGFCPESAAARRSAERRPAQPNAHAIRRTGAR
jgi:hypothetical protein